MDPRTLLTEVTDITDEGLICVDADGMVTLFNRKAKEIIGIAGEDRPSHPAGRLHTGDIVLVVDNILGDDDGDMSLEDLKLLNIDDPEIRLGGSLLCAGVYRNSSIAPLYRHWSRNNGQRSMVLEGEYLGLDLHLEIDWETKRLIICLGGISYEIRFLKALANVVVVDGVTGRVKFYQDKGCTMRQEDLRDLLMGGPYQAKGQGAELDVIGRDFFELVRPGEVTSRLDQILNGTGVAGTAQTLTINKRLVLASLYPLTGTGRVAGAVLKFTDLSEMDTLLKERNELIAMVEETNLNLDNSSQGVPPTAFSTFAGSSPPIQQVKYLAYKAAQAKCNVIITGESGTGKSRLAREIHQISRPGTPFVEVNCSSIPRDLVESELFGYMGGAFTGALTGGKAGYFESANGGTLFLDEIGEIPPELQAKLLYVIQNHRFYRVGATKPTDVDVRIIFATNKDLLEEVRQGRFRQDLYYRISVFPIEIPPLRERIADIYLLSKSLTENTCAEYGLPPKQLSARALDKLLHYDWPGNIRELGNVIERAIAICETATIYPEDIYIGQKAQSPGGGCAWETAAPGAEGRTLREQVAAAERQAILSAIAACGGDKKQAMERLGLRKTTFYEKLHQYGIDRQEREKRAKGE